MSETTSEIKEKARKLANDIRRASRAFDQLAEIAATNIAHNFLDTLNGLEYIAANEAYNQELMRDIPISEMPYTCSCHGKEIT